MTTVFPEVTKPICQTVVAERDSTSLFEGVVTNSENTEMNIGDDIPKEVLSSTALTSHDWHKAQQTDRNIKFIIETAEKDKNQAVQMLQEMELTRPISQNGNISI